MSGSTASMVPTLRAVSWTRRDLPDTVTIGLEGEPGSSPSPGQFNMLWAVGVGEVPISVSGIGPDRAVEHTIRAVGATTSAIVGSEPGDQIGVRGPFGRGWDTTGLAGHDLLIVAGGLGLAPLRPIVEMATTGDLGAGRVSVILGSREPGLLLYADQLGERWSMLDTVVTVDIAEPGWTGRVGTVTPLLAPAIPRPERTVAMVCGPEVMMTVVANELTTLGVVPERIQVSLERNMQCGIGQCGHCQIGSMFACVDGPVVTWAESRASVRVRER